VIVPGRSAFDIQHFAGSRRTDTDRDGVRADEKAARILAEQDGIDRRLIVLTWLPCGAFRGSST